MKNPHRMGMDELSALPVIASRHILDRVDSLGGCFHDRDGVLWGTCLVAGAWARYQAVQVAGHTDLPGAVIDQYSSLRGFIDFCDGTRVDGWAQDEANPDEAVYLDVVVDGKLAARIHADTFRSDLEAAKIGNGRHGFSLSLPKPLARECAHLVVIQRAADGAFVNMAHVSKQED